MTSVAGTILDQLDAALLSASTRELDSLFRAGSLGSALDGK